MMKPQSKARWARKQKVTKSPNKTTTFALSKNYNEKKEVPIAES